MNKGTTSGKSWSKDSGELFLYWIYITIKLKLGKILFLLTGVLGKIFNQALCQTLISYFHKILFEFHLKSEEYKLNIRDGKATHNTFWHKQECAHKIDFNIKRNRRSHWGCETEVIK